MGINAILCSIFHKPMLDYMASMQQLIQSLSMSIDAFECVWICCVCLFNVSPVGNKRHLIVVPLNVDASACSRGSSLV